MSNPARIVGLALVVASCQAEPTAPGRPPEGGSVAASAPAAPRASASTPPAAATPLEHVPPAATEPGERYHSPLTPPVVAHLRRIAARDGALRDDAFIKVGDSITASGDFMRCFANDNVRWGEHAALQSVRGWFLRGTAGGSNPFAHQSLAAGVGWSAWKVLRGPAPPLQQELSTVRPRFALVMFGTNDLEAARPNQFIQQMTAIIGFLTERGVIPILFTIPPRTDRADASALVPRYNARLTELATAEQLPWVDYHAALLRLPGKGLGRDGIHPTCQLTAAGRSPCHFTREGLRHGYNVRNLLALQALGRLRAELQ